jgi:excinuclease ABC subunit C
MLSLNQTTIKHLPSNSGIYQFFDWQQKILYVGKAKNLKKRIASYLRPQTDPKTIALIHRINYVKIIITATDIEALLLENTLIKKFQPKYNIFFKDDKSYPYLFVSKHSFSHLIIYRGAKNQPGDYYGPYPNATAAHETLHLLQKIFGIRQCIDTSFNHRKRPCIQYQIKRCSAPCVNYISKESYQQNVSLLKQFLEGKNKTITHTLTKKMRNAATQLQYEEAAHYREQISHLQKIQTRQYVIGSGGDIDAITTAMTEGYMAVLVLLIRGGKVAGSETYFHHKNPEDLLFNNPNQIIAAFISQYYLGEIVRFIPKKILINEPINNKIWLEKALTQRANYKIKVLVATSSYTPKGYSHWLKMAEQNAIHALQMHLANKSISLPTRQALKEQLFLPKLPKHIECFDISHTKGEFTTASCIVFDLNGPVKKDYRRFNIENITKGDDYAAIEQAVARRYNNHELPDLIIIDGGKGQLKRAQAALKNHKTSMIAIAKGPKRKPGLEVIYTSDKSMVLSKDSPSLHLLQQIRDEAHRFAITGHRKNLAKRRISSILETIPGVGKKKRHLLLEYFAGIQGVIAASIDDLTKIHGINYELAKRIYEALHR